MLKFEKCSPKAAPTPIPPYIPPPLFFTFFWSFMIQNQDRIKTEIIQKHSFCIHKTLISRHLKDKMQTIPIEKARNYG